jgi:hypothetical protein
METTKKVMSKTERKAFVLQKIAKLKAYRNNYAHFKGVLRKHNNKITDYGLKEYTTVAGNTYIHPYIKTQDGNYIIGVKQWRKE